MTTPQYKLRDDHVVVAKHMRDERLRNDNEYHHKNTDLNIGMNKITGVVVQVPNPDSNDVPNIGYVQSMINTTGGNNYLAKSTTLN
jgi:hypothetical protein